MKPDQLIKRRGKLGLIKVNADYKTVQEWITQRMNKDQQVCYKKLTYILTKCHGRTGTQNQSI